MANIGDKYIIEIREEIGKGLYRLKNSADDLVVIPALTIDGFEKWDEQSVIKQLEELSKGVSDDIEAAYQRGLNDAWEAARKIINLPIDGGLTVRDLTNIFGIDYDDPEKVLKDFRGESAIKRIATYEAKKKAEEEIKVGDEVETDYTGNVIIAGKPKDGWYVTIAKNFARYSIHESHIIKKTGRHFPQVAELLDAMKEDGET